MLVGMNRREKEYHRREVYLVVWHLCNLIRDHVLHKSSAHTKLGQELDRIRAEVTSVALHGGVLVLQRHHRVASATAHLPESGFALVCEVGVDDVKGKREVISVLKELVLVVFVKFVPRLLRLPLQIWVLTHIYLVQAGKVVSHLLAMCLVIEIFAEIAFLRHFLLFLLLHFFSFK